MNRTLKAALAAVLAGGMTAAMAQAPNPQGPMGQGMGPGMGMGGPGMQRGPGMRERAMNPADRAEARLAYVKTALKITPAQEPQWNAYANFVRQRSTEMQQRFEQRRQQMQQMREQAQAQPGGPQPGGPQAGPRFQRPGAMERLERQQAMHQEASKRIADLMAVQKPLYDVLTPEQRKVADEVLAPRRFARGPGGPGGMRHG